MKSCMKMRPFATLLDDPGENAPDEQVDVGIREILSMIAFQMGEWVTMIYWEPSLAISAIREKRESWRCGDPRQVAVRAYLVPVDAYAVDVHIMLV